MLCDDKGSSAALPASLRVTLLSLLFLVNTVALPVRAPISAEKNPIYIDNSSIHVLRWVDARVGQKPSVISLLNEQPELQNTKD
jgi:hypothetical protein